MAVDTTVTNDLRKEIVKCNDKQQLVNLRQQLDTFEQSIDMTGVTTFEQKRIKQLIDGLYKILDNKQIQLSMNRFEFIGDPIPPRHSKNQIKLIEKQDLAETNSGSAVFELLNESIDISETRYVLITSSTNSIISTDKLSPPPSIHMRNTTDSICTLTSKGAIFIHNVRNSILVLSCHQARLHNIHNSIIIVDKVKNNRIIIEDCSGLVINQQIEVDDFNHPTKESINPHYKVIDQDSLNHITQRISNCSVEDLRVIIGKCFELTQ
ncbi:hypothetical protein JA1_004080 [Spathaspora sp. JA1]|nr:hypothetical protein JA1_004080 [Spathaspora sp. JA1]